MCLFYLLFLSLSEHVNFIVSYIIAALGTMGTITGYSITILKDRTKGRIIGGLLFGLYCYLFVLIQNQDYTLLLGSLALFAVLGLVMYITRNIDWYNLKK